MSGDGPRAILAVLPGWVGDVVMATPALRALRRAWPDAHLIVEGKPHAVALLAEGAQFDECLPGPPRGVRATLGRARELRARRVELAVLLGESERAALAPFLARVPTRVGHARGALRRAMVTHALERPRDPGGELLAFSMIERYLRVTRAAGAPDAGTGMEVAVGDRSRGALAPRLGAAGIRPDDRLVTLVPGASFGPAKRWPAESFAHVARGLLDRHGLRSVIAPGPGEEGVAQEIAAMAGGAAITLSDPPLTLPELAALLERSALAVSNDTGPRSIAVALGVPVVAVLGPSDPRHTDHHLERQRVLVADVECRPCGLKVCPIDHRCMTRVTPDQVLGAAGSLLALK